MQGIHSIPPEKFIRQTLREQGRSVRWLANQLQCSESNLSHAFAGDRGLSPERIRGAAKVLGIPEFIVATWFSHESPVAVPA